MEKGSVTLTSSEALQALYTAGLKKAGITKGDFTCSITDGENNDIVVSYGESPSEEA